MSGFQFQEIERGQRAMPSQHRMFELAYNIIHFIHRRRGLANYFSNFACRRHIERLRVAFATIGDLDRAAR
jgi:hypothetical protein